MLGVCFKASSLKVRGLLGVEQSRENQERRCFDDETLYFGPFVSMLPGRRAKFLEEFAMVIYSE